jgi:type I restriction enzyme S subunit
LKQKFLSESFQEILKSKATGGTVQGIKGSVLHQIPLIVPSKEEQTKIATFLSAVDEKISQLSQKLHLLGQYKQGMMQKLFSQQIRFKANDGSEFGDWEILKFKDVITIKYGKDHKKLKDGDIPVLGTGGIMRYVDSYLYDGESILIGRKGTIDKPQFISGKFWTVDTLFYTEIGEKIRPKFAFQQLLLVNWLNLNEATGVPSLNTTSIGNIELKVPSLEEQTKIANFLSAIDQKIDVVSEQLEQAKLWKKGLLQQMFV